MADIPKTAKVSVLEAPRKMVVHELPIPEIGDDEILVKVEGRFRRSVTTRFW